MRLNGPGRYQWPPSTICTSCERKVAQQRLRSSRYPAVCCAPTHYLTRTWAQAWFGAGCCRVAGPGALSNAPAHPLALPTSHAVPLLPPVPPQATSTPTAPASLPGSRASRCGARGARLRLCLPPDSGRGLALGHPAPPASLLYAPWRHLSFCLCRLGMMCRPLACHGPVLLPRQLVVVCQSGQRSAACNDTSQPSLPICDPCKRAPLWWTCSRGQVPVPQHRPDWLAHVFTSPVSTFRLSSAGAHHCGGVPQGEGPVPWHAGQPHAPGPLLPVGCFWHEPH